jgi:hypothetical protein
MATFPPKKMSACGASILVLLLALWVAASMHDRTNARIASEDFVPDAGIVTYCGRQGRAGILLNFKWIDPSGGFHIGSSMLPGGNECERYPANSKVPLRRSAKAPNDGKEWPAIDEESWKKLQSG